MSLYAVTVPAWAHSLRCLKSFLSKAEQHAEVEGYAPENLLNHRLFPDMFPLLKQVQIACDLVARGGARLSQMDLPSFPDEENSFADLHVRIDNVLKYLEQLQEQRFEGAESLTLDIPAGGDQTMQMTGQQYVTSFVIPNLYFHITTAYNLLRNSGVPLGKYDFLVPGGKGST